MHIWGHYILLHFHGFPLGSRQVRETSKFDVAAAPASFAATPVAVGACASGVHASAVAHTVDRVCAVASCRIIGKELTMRRTRLISLLRRVGVHTDGITVLLIMHLMHNAGGLADGGAVDGYYSGYFFSHHHQTFLLAPPDLV